MWKARALTLIAGLWGCDPQPVTEPPTKPSTPSASIPVESASAASARSESDLRDERQRFAKKLAVVASRASKAPDKAVRCPPAMNVAGDARVLHAYSLAFAKKVANDDAMSAEEAAMTAFRPPWHELLVEGDAGAVSDEEAAHLRRIFDRVHVAIVCPDKFEMPSVASDASFLAGTFRGWLHVFELATGEAMCSAPLEFMSSDKVEYNESLSPEQAAQRFDIDKSDARFHVRVDYFMRGHAATRRALAEMNEGLTLEVNR